MQQRKLGSGDLEGSAIEFSRAGMSFGHSPAAGKRLAISMSSFSA